MDDQSGGSGAARVGYLVEAPFPGAGQLLPPELDAIAWRAERVAAELGSAVRWERSYLVADGLYLIYLAEREEQVRQHLDRLGLEPATVTVVTATIAPPRTHPRQKATT